jgi:hypothetical protein
MLHVLEMIKKAKAIERITASFRFETAETLFRELSDKSPEKISGEKT